jgi:hypothetical protein
VPAHIHPFAVRRLVLGPDITLTTAGESRTWSGSRRGVNAPERESALQAMSDSGFAFRTRRKLL